jgi:hypothetical protein
VSQRLHKRQACRCCLSKAIEVPLVLDATVQVHLLDGDFNRRMQIHQ